MRNIHLEITLFCHYAAFGIVQGAVVIPTEKILGEIPEASLCD